MKFFRLSLLCVLSFCSATSEAQNFSPGPSNNVETWSQMWSSANTYRNSVTTSNLGTQKDTMNASSTKYLITSRLAVGSTATTDTFIPAPVTGGAGVKMSFTAYVWKAQGTTTVVPGVRLTLMQSIDNTGLSGTLIAVPSATVYTVSPTSATVPSVTTWSGLDKNARFYGIKAEWIVDTVSIMAGYYSQVPVQVHR